MSDERVLAVLNDGKPRFFAQLLGEVGFSRNTLKLRLKRIVAQSLVAKEKTVPNGRGRPKYTYYTSPRARRQVSTALSDLSMTIVTLPFSRIRHLCRFKKGGYYKQTKHVWRRKLPSNPKKQRIKANFGQFSNTHARQFSLVY